MMDQEAEQYFTIVPGVELLEYQTTGRPQSLLVFTSHKRYEVTLAIAPILRALQRSPRNISQIKQALEQESIDLEQEKLTGILAHLEKLEIVTDGKNGFSQNGRKKKKGHFVFRFDLLSEPRLRPLTASLARFFSPSVMGVLIPVLLLWQLAFAYAHWGLLNHLFHSLPSGPKLVLLLVLSYSGLVLHELAHAAACQRFGVRHGAIGLGIYLIFPVFYTDVSESWRLDCKGRVTVGAAGIYASALLATAASIAFLLTKEPLFALLAWIYDITIFFNLNPFIRTDAYWVLSDSLGISNLSLLNRQTTKWLFFCTIGRSEPKPLLIPKQPWSRWAYFAYYSFSIIFWSYCLIRFYIFYLPKLILSMPHYFAHSLEVAQSANWAMLTIIRLLLGMIMVAIPLLGAVFYLNKFLSTYARRAKDRVSF
jgi:putative peptide zinc metalloprotease protein